ncbi:MAG: DUF362 domain-containing protein [Clostridiales bacterium]|jgi:uncharacterized protein (DUF362 family)|nr:DUF362 domain-containing protein [Clostridiales bacterium]
MPNRHKVLNPLRAAKLDVRKPQGRRFQLFARIKRQFDSALRSAQFYIESKKVSDTELPPFEPNAISQVFVKRGTVGADDGFLRLVSLMGENGLSFYKTQEINGLIAPNDIVILKINSQWNKRGGTNTDLLRSVAKAVASHPSRFNGEIVVADNGQAQMGSYGAGGSLSWKRPNSLYKNQSALDVIKELQKTVLISGVLWDEYTADRVSDYDRGNLNDGFVLEDKLLPSGIQISYPKFKTEFGTKISFKKGVWNQDRKQFDSSRLKIINMPVLKTHVLYQATGAIKSYMGTTSCALTSQRSHYSVPRGGMGAQMALTRMPVLNVMDMIWIGAYSGPGVSYTAAIEKNMVAASIDPVALDYWCVKHVLMPEALKASKGSNGLETKRALLDPDQAIPGSFGRWLRLSALEIQKAGIPVALGDGNIDVVSSGL